MGIEEISDFHGQLEKSWLPMWSSVAYLGGDRVMELLAILIVVAVRDLYIFVKTHREYS